MSIKKYDESRKKDFHKKLSVCGVIFLIGIALGVGMFCFLSPEEEKESISTVDTVDKRDIVEIGGVKCVPKDGIETYLFLGVDQRGELTKVKKFDGTGQCDVIQLLVLDSVNKTYTKLVINRDTMVDMTTYNEKGQSLGEVNAQIALAHTNGDVADFGNKVTIETVSKLLYNHPIDGYVSLNMDSIPVINNLAGGVTVTIEDDFSKSDKSLKMGETIKLSDEQAYHYIHDRQNVADGTNENRMKRQSMYLSKLKGIFLDKFKESGSFINQAYDALENYMSTDLTPRMMSRIALNLTKYEEVDSPVLTGKNSMGEFGFIEFRLDQDSLDKAVRKLFYDEIK
ncbi:MAG: LCP family protein [Oscillospiraceae bacterium]|nr:LCP family protein [Oscillospiraceae bacterium]